MIPKKTCTLRATDMPFDPGQIVLVSYPFTDQTSAKLRPALVVSIAKFNGGEDFVAVPISSRADPDDAFSYLIQDTDEYFADTKLRRSSTVKWTKPMTISVVVVQRKLGVIPGSVLQEIQNKIRTVFS